MPCCGEHVQDHPGDRIWNMRHPSFDPEHNMPDDLCTKLVTTDHGCEFSKPREWGDTKVTGATVDCKCGMLLLFINETYAVNFHQELHRRSIEDNKVREAKGLDLHPVWPADGANTGVVEF